MAARRKPNAMKAPGGKTITKRGRKDSPIIGTEKRVPLPRSSRMPPRTARERVKPIPIPKPSAKARRMGFFDAKASARPRMTQFTTISGMKSPRVL